MSQHNIIEKHNLIKSQNLFIMSRISKDMLTHDIQTFHGLFKSNKITGGYLEELMYRSIDIDPDYNGKVIWNSGSHAPGSDIVIYNDTNKKDKLISISVKSGTVTNNFIEISGNRLSQCNSDMNCINGLLKKYISDVLIACSYNSESGLYNIIYIDRSIFNYPENGSGWIPKIGLKTGKISKYEYEQNGIISSITPSMSWQVWWKIPLCLCRIGLSISIDGRKF